MGTPGKGSGSGSGGEPGRPWTATSTWAPAGGAAVEDAVSFETTADDAETSPLPIVLARPPSDGREDPTPCEITIGFTGKYEIHRVYVRSTARTYEIYCSTDLKDASKDYLCTVRCGIAAQEPQPPGEECVSQASSNAATSEKHEQEAKSVTSSSDEDSWVEVKIPESPLGNYTPESQAERNAIGICQKNTLAHYEATAEITDANPCVSLTVRLLSLQSKTSVHIEEIYIFADLVESSSDDSVAGPGNMGGSSLLAMLVPGLMQISKSRDCKIDDKYFAEGLKAQLSEGCVLKDSIPCGNIAKEAGLYGTNDCKFNPAGVQSRLPPAQSGTICDDDGNQHEFPLNDPKPLPLPVKTTENAQVTLAKDKTVSNLYPEAGPIMNENVTPHNHIERMLDTLISKVEKVELCCSRFEDKMMRPLSSIEARLQRLEQQFDSFSVEIQSLRSSSARMSAPNAFSDTINSQQKEHNGGNSGTSASVMNNRQPGLVMRAPEFSSEDYSNCDVADENTVNLHGPNVVPRVLKAPDFICEPGFTCEKLNGGPLPFERERKTSPGLVIKVPEFLNDEEDEAEEDKQAEADIVDDGRTNSDDTLSKSTDNSFKGKTPVSVDGALASALEAFLTSTKGTSPSKSVACTASNVSCGNTDDSSSSFPSHGHLHDTSTKDDFHGIFGDTKKISTSISFQEVDVAPLISVSKANLVSSVESLTGSIDDYTQVNGQNNGPSSDMIPLVTSTEPVDDPSQLATHSGSVDGRTQAKPPTIFQCVGETAQVDESRPSLPLAEFLVARNAFRNGTSEVCCGNDDAAIPSFQRTLTGAHQNLEGGDSKASQQNPIFQLSLLKKAFEVDEGDGNFCDDISIETTFEPSSHAAPANGANRHSTNAMETLSDEDGVLENTKGSIMLSGGHSTNEMETLSDEDGVLENTKDNTRLSGGMDSVFCGSLYSGPSESFRKPEVEHSLSDLSSTEPSDGDSSREATSSGNAATGNHVEDLFAGNGAGPDVSPTVGSQENDILGMAFVPKRTSTSSPSLEVLLAESSDSESQISAVEESDSDAAGLGSDHLFTTFPSSDDDAFAMDGPLFDVVDEPAPSEVNACASSKPLLDVVDLTNPSETYTPSVNGPFPDVVDLPEPSSLYASAADELFASVDNLPKTSETFVGGSSGEHPDSLI
ncbi:hypothetical protein CFC21_022844 [Triticum aestivum]|uniref:Uncharacterized protein n=3 Tax=Triticum TaxID=4564 RepID=A0A9R1PJL9_TRITD|nr:hypothetical protein CFC21_022844 [Triticum aestivum]VAH44640.1 unnamed protein product [Triticum turgidum subsp. durum]